jgi:hypothetical protein
MLSANKFPGWWSVSSVRCYCHIQSFVSLLLFYFDTGSRHNRCHHCKLFVVAIFTSVVNHVDHLSFEILQGGESKKVCYEVHIWFDV